ncbi:MAG: hypothetical protein QM811_04625 [Pirellulales bacterium]
MSAAFDPYLQWLGIREKQRPVHHYRLLGLELYESEANIIAQAADRQMAHVRQFQAGEFAIAADKLLNELAAARLCLLKPERKADYDRRLREKLAEGQVAAPALSPAPSVAAKQPQHAQLGTQPMPGQRMAPVPLRTTRPVGADGGAMPYAIEQPPVTPPVFQAAPQPKPSPVGMWTVLIGLVGAVVVLTGVLALRKSPEEPVAQGPKTPPAKTEPVAVKTPSVPTETPPQTEPTNPSTTVAPTVPTTPVPGTETPATTVVPNEANPATPVTPAPAVPKPVPSVTVTTPMPVGPTNPATVAPAAPTMSEKTMPEKGMPAKPVDEFEAAINSLGGNDPGMMEPLQGTMTPPKAAPVRMSVPEKAAIAAKTKEIREIFKADYAARDQGLSKKLLEHALEASNDAATTYVLASESRELAAYTGDYNAMSRAGRILTESFGVDVQDEDIAAFAKMQNLPNKPAPWFQGLLSELNERSTTAMDNNDYDRAARYANMAKALATKTNATAEAQVLTARIKELGALKTQYAKVKVSHDLLKTSPNDAAANADWGAYLCLIKGEFTTGLPHVAKGSDAALSKLAQREAASPRDANETMAIADEWWAYGDKAKDTSRNNARRHAGDLYQDALPGLKGLSIAKVEKRLEELATDPSLGKLVGKQLEKSLIMRPWTVKWTNVPDPFRRFGPPPGGNNPTQNTEETITFMENGRVESRYFDAYEIRNDVIELRIPVDNFGGGGGGGGRQYIGKGLLVGSELRLIYAREDRLKTPANQGVGHRARTTAN